MILDLNSIILKIKNYLHELRVVVKKTVRAFLSLIVELSAKCSGKKKQRRRSSISRRRSESPKCVHPEK